MQVADGAKKKCAELSSCISRPCDRLFSAPTCELVDPGLLRHVGEGDDALREVAGRLIHLYEGVRAHVPAGVVGDVNGVAACSLRGTGRNSVRVEVERRREESTDEAEETHTRTHTHRHHPPFTCGIQAQIFDLHRLRVTHPAKGFSFFFYFLFLHLESRVSFSLWQLYHNEDTACGKIVSKHLVIYTSGC